MFIYKQIEVKCGPTWLSLFHNKNNNHCNKHYIGNYTYPQKSTNDDKRDASNCMDTSEKLDLKSDLAWKLPYQYYTLTNSMTLYAVTKGISKRN